MSSIPSLSGSSFQSSPYDGRQESSQKLIEAAKSGNLDEVQALLSMPIPPNIDAVNNDGCTALMLAAFEGHTEVVGILIEHGANVDAVDVNAVGNNACTALMVAIMEGHTETAKMLIESGANVNAVGKWGLIALIIAASDGHTEIVDLLLRKGAHIPSGLYGEEKIVVSTALNQLKREEEEKTVKFTFLRGLEEETSELYRFKENILYDETVVSRDIFDFVPPQMISWKENNEISSISIEEAIDNLTP
jgi:ankyrin repeat protein